MELALEWLLHSLCGRTRGYSREEQSQRGGPGSSIV